jgi:hypothetical protein
MKLEIRKETKTSLENESGVVVWYWVVVDDNVGLAASRPFNTQESAEKYYATLKSFYSTNGTFGTVTEILLSETIETPTHEPA